MSNCLIFALERFFKYGGFCVWRKSRHGFWWHFMWSPDLKRFEEYVPLTPTHEKVSPPILFRGRVKHSLAEEQEP